MTEFEEFKIKEQICEVGRDMWTLGMVSANDGNISVKLDDGTFLTTPTGVSKGKMTTEMIIKIDGGLNILSSGNYRPSSEFKMHLRCYKERPDIGAVVHAHPPYATAFAAAGVPLDQYSLSEAVMLLGSVPVAPYGTPGTDEVPESIAPFLPYHDAILLANHGAVTVGVDLMQAYYRMESLEHISKTIIAAQALGGTKELPRNKIDELCEIAKNYPIRHPGYKKYS